jgi:hypothetical protein
VYEKWKAIIGFYGALAARAVWSLILQKPAKLNNSIVLYRLS